MQTSSALPADGILIRLFKLVIQIAKNVSSRHSLHCAHADSMELQNTGILLSYIKIGGFLLLFTSSTVVDFAFR